MRNPAPFRRRAVSMTPLIDVVFLLLLFFMLTSTFSSYGEIELKQATTGRSEADAQVDRAFVQLGQERLTLNGVPVTFGDLASAVDANFVLVSLDDDVSAQRVVDLLVWFRGRPELNVVVLE